MVKIQLETNMNNNITQHLPGNQGPGITHTSKERENQANENRILPDIPIKTNQIKL